MVAEEKIKQVGELVEEASQSGAVVLSDYRGLTVAEMTSLRKKLSEIGADFRVVKNTLLRLALDKSGLSGGDAYSGPTAALFSRSADPIESVKVLVTFLKEKAKGEIKMGFFERTQMVASELLALAALPGKAVLQAQLVSRLAHPIYGLVYSLSSCQRRLVLVLGEINKKKGGER